MAIWIGDEGYVIEIHLHRAGLLMEKQDVRDWVGEGFSIFHLDTDLFMIADLSSKSRGAGRNVRAIELLRHSPLEPLTEIFGDVLIVRRDEVSLENLLSGD
jgi:hypothetical protein